MKEKSGSMTIERLREFGEAWDWGDVDTLMQFMADDSEYRAFVGPEPGRTYLGREEVRRGFEEMLAHDAGGESRGGSLRVMGDFGVAEWAYQLSDDAGNETLVRGCDLFEFEGRSIKVKDAFRKTPA